MIENLLNENGELKSDEELGLPAEPNIEQRLKTLEARLRDVELERQEIEKVTATVDRLAQIAERKKSEAKAAKEKWEAAVGQHLELCRHWSKSEEVASRPLIAVCEAKADPVLVDESWKEEPIEVLMAFDLSFSEGLIETLENLGFHTLGHLADWSRDNDGFNGIVGIGKVKAKVIEDAFMAYWDARAADVQDADDDEDDIDADIDPQSPGTMAEDDTDAAEDAEAVADQAEPDEVFGDPDTHRGLNLVTSHPGSNPESNGVEADPYREGREAEEALNRELDAAYKPKKRRKAKA
jgi:hypothetical protein